MQKLVVLMMEENIYGRALLDALLGANYAIQAVVIEKGTPRAQKMLGYLSNDFFNPPLLSEMIPNERIHTVSNLTDEAVAHILRDAKPDILLLGGSSRIITPNVFMIPRMATLNAHPGLLPEYKGRDVVGWAVYNNDPVGATCHIIDAGVDTGPILLRRELQYSTPTSLLALRIRVMQLAIQLLVEAVTLFAEGKAHPVMQGVGQGKEYSPMPLDVLAAVEARLKEDR